MDKEAASGMFESQAIAWGHMRDTARWDVGNTRYATRGHSWASQRLMMRLEGLLGALIEESQRRGTDRT